MFIVTCPHCHADVWIEQVNCGIFRHGVFKHNYQQIPPHASRSECDQYVFEGQIHGCGKPFQVVEQPNGQQPDVRPCEYI
jgi:hypothetical protein